LYRIVSYVSISTRHNTKRFQTGEMMLFVLFKET